MAASEYILGRGLDDGSLEVSGGTGGATGGANIKLHGFTAGGGAASKFEFRTNETVELEHYGAVPGWDFVANPVITTGYIKSGVHFSVEQAAAEASVAGLGQLWVKNTTPNELWFTDDAGTDVQLGIPGAGDLLADGTIPLTQNWDVGGFTITGTQFISDIATGTAPFVVASTTEVANLKAASVTTNADLTGHVTSTGNATILGSFTKSQLSTAVSDGTPLYSGDVTSNIPVATDAIWDAAGDLAVGTGADTAVRLALGTALQVLRVNAGATAPEWAAAAAGAGVFGLYKSTDYTAVNGDYVFVDTTGAVVAITLPASPADGELVWIGDYGGVALTNNITINRNANLIDSAAANILINVNDQYALLIWDNANSTWRSYQSAYVWGSGGGGLDASVKTGAYTILASEDVGVDSSGGVFDITLKLTPSVGDVAYIRDVGQSCGTNAVGILRNGSTINGAAADESLNVDNGLYLFTYDGSTWVFTPITVGGLNQTQVDARVLAVTASALSKVVTGTTYTVLVGDAGYNLIFTNAAAIAVTLPNTFAVDFHFVVIQTTAAGIPTVTRSGADTINGAATGVAPSAQWKGMYMTQYAANTWLALM